MVTPPRHLVQQIYLYINLPRYSCSSCEQDPHAATLQPEAIFRRAKLKLFSVLVTWQPTGRLVLELNVSSPQHWLTNCPFGNQHGIHQQAAPINRRHGPELVWVNCQLVNGQWVNNPGVEATVHLFTPCCTSLPEDLPTVQAVTGLVVRQQIRHLGDCARLTLLREKLPRLESIVLE
ncbi:hypothetical protein P170DRAFT_60540 [Aspergillus steynii IBT 23096]|uniref:Uncharacterized protein n=1 Tax=Aspergillus steynii IBT 23096 TaxID=1392250 RepID=A0A2I2FSU7_9EURO|nr:uncharacterized protein P170DRAFT_60540 [Aspergillus steynii IBT 23096]PLB43694.1 hypothetical protein P170DRAFT_60540 [Aspergillus steynii IBT 23096]